MDNKHRQNHQNPTIPTAQAYTPKLQLDRWHTTFVWWGGAPLLPVISDQGQWLLKHVYEYRITLLLRFHMIPNYKKLQYTSNWLLLIFFPYQNFIYGYGSIPITVIPFLVGWTSNYQLFWCSPGVPGFWHTAIYQTKTTRFSMTFYEKPFIDLQSPQGRAQHLWYGSGAIMWPMRHRQALRGAFHFIIHHPFWSALTSLFAISAKSGNYFLHSSILHLNHT